MSGKNASIYSESCGAFSPVKLYRVDSVNPGNGKLSLEIKSSNYDYEHELSSSSTKNAVFQCNSLGANWVQQIKVTLRQVFLPSGYPKSVSNDYIKYQIWDTVQAFASSITGALATEAVLKGVGVGNASATTLAATVTWLLKSGSGMIGNIIFAWAKGMSPKIVIFSRINAFLFYSIIQLLIIVRTSLDHNCKKWRLFADILNDFAIFVDLINPLFPSQMTVIVLSCSSIFRSIVGVAGGATRAAITQHQARNNNMAVSRNPFAVWTLFALFTCVHLFANYRAVKALQMETLNLPRLLICASHYLRHKAVPSILNVNLEESVIIGRGIKDVDVCDFKINLGVSLEKPLEKVEMTKDALTDAIKKSYGKSFIIIPKLHQKQINVILQENISPEDILEAYFRSVAVAAVDSEKFLRDGKLNDSMDPVITHMWMEFHRLLLAKGFLIDRALLATGDWRAKWKLE